MNDGVLYINIGLKHATHLVVSLWTLRRHWRGPVAIAAGCDASRAFVDRLVADKRLGPLQRVDFDYQKQAGKRSGSVYLAKTSMARFTPFDRTAFLDADTFVAGPIDDVFPQDAEIRLTQFCQWTTRTAKIRRRIAPWAEVCPDEVQWSLDHEYPAINTGVMGWRLGTISDHFHLDWAGTTAKRVCFICDELAAQLIAPYYPCQVLDDRWNASPKFAWERHGFDTPGADPRIWHGHGFKFVKSANGRRLWVPAYEEALSLNVGGIAEHVPIGADKAAKWRKYETLPDQPDEDDAGEEVAVTQKGRTA